MWFRTHKHDVETAVVIFAMAFSATLMKGGSLNKSLLISAAVAGAGAVIHTFLERGA